MSSSPEFAAGAVNSGSPATLVNADTETDGTGADTLVIFTAPTTGKGAMLPKLRCKPLGNNVVSLLRIFKNNGSAPNVAANNALIKEATLPAVTLSATAENADVIVPLDEVLKMHAATPERLTVCLATAVASGWKITPSNGGDF